MREILLQNAQAILLQKLIVIIKYDLYYKLRQCRPQQTGYGENNGHQKNIVGKYNFQLLLVIEIKSYIIFIILFFFIITSNIEKLNLTKLAALREKCPCLEFSLILIVRTRMSSNTASFQAVLVITKNEVRQRSL